VTEGPKSPRDSSRGVPDAPNASPSPSGEANRRQEQVPQQSAEGGESGKGAGAPADPGKLAEGSTSTARGAVDGRTVRPASAPDLTGYPEETADGNVAGEAGSSPAGVELPEFEVYSMESDETLLDRGNVISEVKVHPLAGIWGQVSGPNTPDFGPGGYERSVLMLNPTANVSAVYRSFRGGVAATVVGGELALDAPLDDVRRARGVATIRKDPSLSGSFPNRPFPLGPLPDGTPVSILPQDGEGPWRVEWEREGRMLRFGDRLYAPLGREEFEDLRRGGADIPTESDLATRIPAREGGTSAVSPPNESSFFGVRGAGKRVCLICDISGSMQGPKLDRLKAELEKSIRGFGDETRFLVVFFDGAAHTMDQKWMHGKADRQRALALVQAQGTGGGTDPTAAFNFAFGSLSPIPDVIYFMTDGMIPQGIPSLVKSLNVGKATTVVHAIAFGEPMAEPIMRQIAKENRGTFLYVAP
jgi:hypothetical protein